jgi:homoserine O-acetyltransferase
MVGVHRLLLKQLGIDRLAVAIGGSFGGMQVIEWVIRFPDMLERGIVIASSASLSSQALAFDLVGRKAITSDPDWQGGDYYESGRSPSRGLSLARKVGHITYLSREIMAHKFGREKWQEEHEDLGSGSAKESRLDRFHVETYLEHQGEKFTQQFDANAYLGITQAMDEYDVAVAHGGLHEAFKAVQAKILVVAVSSDWLFPPEQSEALANALLKADKPVSYCLLNAPYGHDAFLVDVEYLSEVMRSFLPWVGPSQQVLPGSVPGADATRQDFRIICDMVRAGSRVLDLGCGGGALLSSLSESEGSRRLGVEIDISHVIQVIERGHDVFQADIDAGLAMIPDAAYDYAILTETLQAVKKPRLVLNEMLRVASEGVLSFPNYGSWYRRFLISLRGRMPQTEGAQAWYETSNIRPFTYADFVDLCRKDRIRILDTVALSDNWLGRVLIKLGLVNLGASSVVVKIARQGEKSGVTHG